jgi:hypothetical protein
MFRAAYRDDRVAKKMNHFSLDRLSWVKNGKKQKRLTETWQTLGSKKGEVALNTNDDNR